MTNDQIVIDRATEYSEELQGSVNKLLQHLNSNLTPVSKELLEELLGKEHIILLIARDTQTNAILGMLTLSIIYLLEGKRGMIDDVVVDENARGQGIGRSLSNKAIEIAKKKGLYALYLTSRPSRVSATNLYISLGFEKYETNVYKLKL